MTWGRRLARAPAGRQPPANALPVDVHAIREHFLFPATGRIAANNAASTQPPAELLGLYQSLAREYENVHRGQSSASLTTTARFEDSYDTARFIGAPDRSSIALYRNTTEAINAVMYSLLTEFRDGDNVVTTTMEHISNYVPWYALCREILPRLGRRVAYRLARFDPVTGELDLQHLASLIDARTKLVCCTGASNFLGTKIPLAAVRALADRSGYCQPDGERPHHRTYFGTARPLERHAVHTAMNRVSAWNTQLTSRALAGLSEIPGITLYGPRDPARRTSLVAFNLDGHDPMSVAGKLNVAGVESRAGCHCATLAHHALRLTPPASCRLSFYLYNTPDEVDQAVAAVAAIAAGRSPARHLTTASRR